MAKLEYSFEDFAVGDTFDLGEYGEYTTADEIMPHGSSIRSRFILTKPPDGNPTFFGGLVASGWHTRSIMMRMNVDNLLSRSSSIGSRSASKR